MKKFTPLLPVVVLVAGISVAVASSQDPQANQNNVHKRSYRVWIRDSGSFLGVFLEEMTPETAHQLNRSGQTGALLTKIVPDSPADEAGLLENDVIISWDGSPVESARDLQRLVRQTEPGTTVNLGVLRDGQEIGLAATLGEPSQYERVVRVLGPDEDLHFFSRDELDEEALRQRLDDLYHRSKDRDVIVDLEGEDLHGEMDHLRLKLDDLEDFHFSGDADAAANIKMVVYTSRLGAKLENLTAESAEKLGVEEGALVSSIDERSAAEQAGLKAGDVILAIDHQPIKHPGEALKLIRQRAAGAVDFQVMRDQQQMNLWLMLPEQDDAQDTKIMIRKRVVSDSDDPSVMNFEDVDGNRVIMIRRLKDGGAKAEVKVKKSKESPEMK